MPKVRDKSRRVGRGLIPLTLRLNPDTHKGLEKIIDKQPHLTMNVLINEILERELSARLARRG